VCGKTCEDICCIKIQALYQKYIHNFHNFILLFDKLLLYRLSVNYYETVVNCLVLESIATDLELWSRTAGQQIYCFV